VQDFSKGDDAVDGLALAYADEQRITNSTGHMSQLILQVKVGQCGGNRHNNECVPTHASGDPASGQWGHWRFLSWTQTLRLMTECWRMHCRCIMRQAAMLPQQT
jgi:hypothetical protein